LLGPNGAGKSTIVKILTGILTPTSGQAHVGGIVPYEKPRELARHIGVVFGQRSRLWWNLPVLDSFAYTKALYLIEDKTYDENINYFSKSFAIDEFITKPVRTLSLGQRMRAEITMAMLHNPEILYLDEPTIGLDVVGKNELHKLIHRLNTERNTTLLLVTHDVIDIERLCSRVMIIDHGKMTWEGSIDALKHSMGSEKRFIVTFDSAVSQINLPWLIPEDGGDGQRQIYTVLDSSVDIDQIIGVFFAAGKVTDLVIKDAELDTVMRKIYTT
jgi:ABC-2 type transport system ATP-binding protein